MKLWQQYNWTFWEPEQEPLPEVVTKERKISICTNCMGRTYDLKRTYIKNIC